MPRLTAYELEREENIRKNQELLKSLGSFELGLGKRKAAPDKGTDKKKKKPRQSGPSTQPIAVRKSSRLLGTVSQSSDPIDFLSESKSPTPLGSKTQIRLRTLPTPTIPVTNAEWSPGFRAPPPTRDVKDGTLRFAAEPHFTPNMTPEEMLREGSFGGIAFRRHHSKILQSELSEHDYEEFPSSWYAGLDVDSYLTSSERDGSINKYGVNAGQTLEEWERSGWINKQDPRGWFQWYFRFYLGRRSRDDERQIKRWLGICGPSGRFRKSLVKNVAESGGRWGDPTVSPVLRQTLQHWAYRLTRDGYEAYL